MRQFSTEDIILENKIAKFLHAAIGEEGKLWRRASREKFTIFTVDEDNAFSFTMKIFDNDPRIKVIPNITQEASHGTLRSDERRAERTAASAETEEASRR